MSERESERPRKVVVRAVPVLTNRNNSNNKITGIIATTLCTVSATVLLSRSVRHTLNTIFTITYNESSQHRQWQWQWQSHWLAAMWIHRKIYKATTKTTKKIETHANPSQSSSLFLSVSCAAAIRMMKKGWLHPFQFAGVFVLFCLVFIWEWNGTLSAFSCFDFERFCRTFQLQSANCFALQS